MKRFDEELARVKKLYNVAREENWGFVRYTEAEFDHLGSELKHVVDPELAVFVELEGQIAGMAVCLPDANQVLKRVRERLLSFGIIAFLRRKKIIGRLRLAILVLMLEYRNKGLERVLVDELYKKALSKGYQRCECSWVLEDNRAMNRALEVSGVRLYKPYRIYQKGI